MVTVTHNTSAEPVSEPAKPASDVEVIHDSKGRAIELKKPHILRNFDIFLAVGPDAAANATYMNVIVPILWVKSIDGAEIHPPTTKLQLDSLISRLNDEGVEAVHGWFTARMLREQALAAAGNTAAKN